MYGGRRRGRSDQGRALAWFGVTMGLAFVSGQILGGLLLQADVFGLGWRAIFLVNVPVTLLLQAGLGQAPLRAGLEAGPLALAFTAMSILGPRLAARLGPWSITLGAGLDVLGTIALVLTGVRYGGHLTGWDLAPATAIIGLGQGMALPSLIGAALSHVPPERAGAAAGILTTAQQFGVASGVAVVGAVFYSRLGVTRASSVSAVELAMAVNAVVVLAAAALTLPLPRRSPARRPTTERSQPRRSTPPRQFTSRCDHHVLLGVRYDV